MNRVIPGVIMVGAWLAACWGPDWLLALLVFLGAGIALHEYFLMTCPSLARSLHWYAVMCAMVPTFAAFSGQNGLVLLGLFASLAAFAVSGLVRYGGNDGLLRFLGAGAFASLYIGLDAAFLMLLGGAPQKTLWLLLLVAITAGSDTGAYYAGKHFGTHKIFPLLSPKKTLEGIIGGLAAGVAAAFLVHTLMHGPFSFSLLAVSATLLVGAGIVGDLTESMLKRICGVKDSGTILAGHGGVLDRIDSILLTAPLLYALLYFQRFL